MSDIEVKPVDDVVEAEIQHEEVVEEAQPVEEVHVVEEALPVEEKEAQVVKGSRGHRPKVSPSKKLNVYIRRKSVQTARSF